MGRKRELFRASRRMRLGKWLTAVALSFFFSCGDHRPPSEAAEGASRAQGVREPILAGTWYPGSADSLRKTIEGYLSRAEVRKLEGEVRALVVPHAGYMYSGQVAACAYSLLRGSAFTRVILIGPSHRGTFKGVSVDLHAGYRTPLGTAPVDHAFAVKLMEAGGSLVRSIPQAHAREHSLEIQVPFLQEVLKGANIVPLTMGEQDGDTCTQLADALVRLIGEDRKTLIVASTDLSHFHGNEQAKRLDQEFIRHLRAMDPKGLVEGLSKGTCEACGGGPTVTTLIAARALGADRAEILRYATSGDVSGDHKSVVGYVSAALIQGK